MNLIKTEWKNDKIGNVCKVISGGTPSRKIKEYFGGNIPWLTPSEISKDKIKIIFNSVENITQLGLNKSSAKILPKGTILLTSRATIGLIAIAGNEITTNQGFANFICDYTKINNHYLAYWLHANLDLLKSLSSGTTFKEISKTNIRNIKIPLPPLVEQKRIAALFQAFDDAIEQTEAQEKNLRELKRQLLNDLFNIEVNFGSYLKGNDYTTIKFQDIAENISERVEPNETNLEIYVGLEHIDSDNLRIERTGKPSDVKGTKLKVYKGDIIFGKRRAYLRKVAVSHFDGICSAHSMVLRAINENIEKEFLPFFMQSDYFMDRAVQISEGSLSPTIKWKVLGRQEFKIPIKNKQDKLVSLFSQIDTNVIQIRDFRSSLKNLKQNLLDEILG